MRAILTPLDGSRLAEESLRAACATARRTGAVLHMVLVHHPVAPNADSAAMATACRAETGSAARWISVPHSA